MVGYEEELGPGRDKETYVTRVVKDQAPEAITESRARKATRGDGERSQLGEDSERGLHQDCKGGKDLTTTTH